MLTKEQLEDTENVKRRVQSQNMADGKSIKKKVQVLFRIIPPTLLTLSRMSFLCFSMNLYFYMFLRPV